MSGTRVSSRRRVRRGFTIIEATLATLIVAVAGIAALTSATKSITNRARVADRVKAQQLAMDLMSEILQQAYQDPVQPPVFGLEPGESPTCRAAWNDVDDYNGWTESPPQTKAGTVIPDTMGLTRSVLVQWADPTTMFPTTTANTGIKLITVTVTRSSLVLASVSAYRTLGWVDTIPKPTDATSNHPPTAAATVASGQNLTGNGAPFTTGFSGTGSSDPDGDTLSYVWNFGDGSSAAGATVTHTYNAVGTYTVTLTVYDGRGGVGVSSLTVTVNPKT